MELQNKATRIRLFDFSSVQMRAFHMSWFAFFLCFFAWFGIAPLMKVVREEFSLTKDQVGWCIIGSVSITVIGRLFIGWLCDIIGPRLAYTGLLLLGSIPVMGIGFADSYASFLAFRVAIGAIGASFVITQYHTSIMFAPNCVGTANATTAGWGNLGGGVTQLVMPLLFAGLISLFAWLGGYLEANPDIYIASWVSPYLANSQFWAWRISMFAAGVLCALTGIAYYFMTQDAPDGNFSDLRKMGLMPEKTAVKGTFREVCKDRRVWALFVIYGACFGIELTFHNVAALYFIDHFEYFQNMSSLKAVGFAGLVASLFGLTNLFARTLGGVYGDKFGQIYGLSGRVRWLFVVLLCEGLALMLFSQMKVLAFAIPSMFLFSICVQMSSGATYSVVPFINKKALGSVAGIVGAGGNAGAIAAGFLFKSSAITWPSALLVLGALVTCCSFLTFAVTFQEDAESEVINSAGSNIKTRHHERQPVPIAT